MKVGSVELSVMDIRNGKNGEPYNADAILAGSEYLMTRSKIAFDSSMYGPEGEPNPDVSQDIKDTRIECFYDGFLESVYDGGANLVEGKGTHWQDANKSSWDRKSDDKEHPEKPFAGHFHLKFMGGPGGGHTASVRMVYCGVASNEAFFPLAD
jgi:hypothetical protein